MSNKNLSGLIPLDSWGFGNGNPFIIAGPCGVESEKQITELAHKLKGKTINLLRGGIWKPRTRPDSFQGIGEEGLLWLKAAGLENGLPVIVEVAHPRHVEQALSVGIDCLWIGARTTVNPFLVQEIASALKGVDIPVFVKNPINPELELWIGALERFYNSGIRKLGAIHRGFSSYEKSKYRNVPNWQIPIELKRRFPELPVLCDPSHIGGSRELVGSLSQTAMDLSFEGLMVEVHPDPSKALSDKDQQLLPSDFLSMIGSLLVRKKSVDDVIFLNLLEELRDRIDRIDEEILQFMAERMSIAREIGQYKKENNMTILQVERWNEILRTRQFSGLQKDLTRDFIIQLFEKIHDESIFHQTQVMNSSETQKEKH